MLEELINNSDNSSDTKLLAMLRQIIMLNNNIFNPGDKPSSLEDNGKFWGDWS